MMTQKLGITTIGRFDYGPLIAGDFPKAAFVVTLKAGQDYKRGSVLGFADATGQCSLVESGKSDGTQTPYAVLAEDVDAKDDDAIGTAYATGEFAREFLIFGGSDTYATHERAARNVCMFFRKTSTAPNE